VRSMKRICGAIEPRARHRPPRAAVVLFALALGCGGSPDDAGPQSPAELGELANLRAVADPWLRAELARIEEDGGTPEQLTGSSSAGEQDAASGFEDLFPKSSLTRLLLGTENLFPDGEFRFDPVELEKAIEFRRRYDAQRLAARQLLERPGCDFHVQFTEGFSAKLDFIPVIRVLGRLEAFEAAEALAADELPRAAAALQTMLQLAGRLDAATHLDARLSAALLRAEAFRVLGAIVDRCRARPEQIERLRQVVLEHLNRWPEDAQVWIAERALGLWAYEMVRVGQTFELLGAEEAKQLAEETDLPKFTVAAERNVDRDERYYLEAMRKIIDISLKPYHARRETFAAIREDLQQKRATSEFPLVAGRLLLPDVWEAQEVLARDRANWEAWAAALSAAAEKPPPFDVNPLTGEEYRIERLADDLVVTGFGTGTQGDFPEIRVPMPAE